MSSRQVVVVPADRTMNLQKLSDVSTLIAPDAADIHLVRVHPRDAWRPDEDRRERSWRLYENDSASIVTARGRAGSHTAVRTVHLRGTPERIVPGYAQLTGASAIILDRNYGSTRLWPSAAVAAHLSRWSPVPVLVLPASESALERVSGRRIRRIVAPLNFTVASAVGLQTAVDLAREHDAELAMLHAIQGVPDHLAVSGGEARRIIEQLARQQRTVARRLQYQVKGLGYGDAESKVVTGDPVAAIVSAVAEADADIIVIAASPRTRLDRFVFGSTLDGVLRRVDVPVLVVPVMGGEERWPEDTVGPRLAPYLRSDFLADRAA